MRYESATGPCSRSAELRGFIRRPQIQTIAALSRAVNPLQKENLWLNPAPTGPSPEIMS